VVRNHGDPFRSLPEPGIAIAAPAGTEVHAVADGRVISRVLAGDTPDSVWGHTVVIAHSGEMASSYAHLGQVLVEEGDRVEQGEAIGTVGTTGRTERPMLAFRLFSDQRLVDPVEHLP
jgi:murein DD-endopeptidase MepM/ murein hydrolase activator NlpD